MSRGLVVFKRETETHGAVTVYGPHDRPKEGPHGPIFPLVEYNIDDEEPPERWMSLAEAKGVAMLEGADFMEA